MMFQELVVKSLDSNAKNALVNLLGQFNCLGSQEFSIDEQRVDEILGDRSYSGGDLPLSVIEEVEEVLLNDESHNLCFYFEKDQNLGEIEKFLNENNFDYSLQEQEEKDWNKEWRKHYEPLLISKKLEIVPSWMDDYKSSAENVMKIYPGQGFGTGNHETTFLCLKLLVDNEIAPRSVLDFGAGSGILGIATQIMNNTDCDYYDIAEDALENNQQNLDINNIKNNFRLLLSKDRTLLKSDYDLIFANILKPVLIEEAPNLFSTLKQEGFIILSGLLVEQMQEVINLYTKMGFKLITQETKNDWGAILLKK